MAEFIKNRPFRFWCQKVLPLVYDDSLSYYELLCKVVCKLNELAENQNNLSDEIKQVAQDLNDFKNQVPGMVEAKVEEWLNNYITTHGLVNSVNGMTGVVTLTATDVGAIANVNGSVKNNNIADGAVTTEKIADGAVTGDKIADKGITANKLADGVIPEKLPNPHKLTFSGGATGEYDGSEDVNINIPAGGGGGGGNAPLTFTGAVDATYDGTEAVTVNIPQGGSGGGAVNSVNGMTGDVVLKKLNATANGGLSISGEQGYNGSTEQTIGIAAGGVTADKIANGAVTTDKLAGGVIPDKLPNPQKLRFTGAVSAEYDGSQEIAVNISSAPSTNYITKSFSKTIGGAPAYFIVKYRPHIDFYIRLWSSQPIPVNSYSITETLPSDPGTLIGTSALVPFSNPCKVCGGCAILTDGTTLTVNFEVEKQSKVAAQIYLVYAPW